MFSQYLKIGAGIAVFSLAIIFLMSTRKSAYDAGYNAAILEMNSKINNIQQENSAKIDLIEQNAADEIKKVHDSYISALSSADSLHQQIEALRADHATAVAGKRKAEQRLNDLLPKLFRLADERAGALARAADESYQRGLACESAYNAIKKAP